MALGKRILGALQIAIGYKLLQKGHRDESVTKGAVKGVAGAALGAHGVKTLEKAIKEEAEERAEREESERKLRQRKGAYQTSHIDPYKDAVSGATLCGGIVGVYLSIPVFLYLIKHIVDVHLALSAAIAILGSFVVCGILANIGARIVIKSKKCKFTSKPK